MSNEQEELTDSFQRKGFVVRKERLYGRMIAACAVLTIIVTVGIILSLTGGAVNFWLEVPPIEFFTGTNWAPGISKSYGFLPLLSGTLIVTVVSALIALPIGLAAAIYLSEYASERARSVLKPALEVLAGIPTVIYGYMALVYITPAFQGWLPISATIIPQGVAGAIPDIPVIPEFVPLLPEFTLVISEFVFVIPSLRTFNVLSASIAVGIMIIPMVSSISEDALSSVPDELREAGYGMGSTKFDVSTKIVVPAATSGIVASYVLALSRAIGETMIVAMAMGTSARMPYFPNVMRNLADSGQTITSAIVEGATGDSITGVTFDSIYALGITLFVITFLMNILAEVVRRRYQEEY